jgi:hypothetical protein
MTGHNTLSPAHMAVYYYRGRFVPRMVGAPEPESGNDANTTVLLHMNGADLSTTFTDTNAGGSAHAWTANGDAKIKTDSSKFGGASGFFDGTGDYITTPDHADWDFGSADWTIDLQFSRTGGDNADRGIIGNYNAPGTNLAFLIGLTNGNKLWARCIVGGTTHTITGTTSVLAAGFHHAALVRSGANLTLYMDGAQEAQATTLSGAMAQPAVAIGIGRPGGSANFWHFTGYVDEVRISKGSVRWSAPFTPPTAAYGPG